MAGIDRAQEGERLAAAQLAQDDSVDRQRTQLSNAMRAHLAEFGIAAPIGRNGIEQLLDVIADPTDERVPADARFCLEMLAAQLRIVKEQILENDRRILASARETELGRRLMEIPGVGPLLASAIVATVPDPAISAAANRLYHLAGQSRALAFHKQHPISGSLQSQIDGLRCFAAPTSFSRFS